MELCDSSDWVVEVRVVGERDSIHTVAEQVEIPIAIAELEVLSCLKSPDQIKPERITPQLLNVRYWRNRSCPKPPSYPVGDQRIAFLAGPDSNGYFATMAPPYGSLGLNVGDSPNWRAAIEGYLDLASLRGREREYAMGEWILECVKLRGVREVVGLNLSYYLAWNWRYTTERDERAGLPRLSARQQLELARILREEPRWSQDGLEEFYYYPLCIPHADTESLQYMARRMAGRDRFPNSLGDAIIELAQRLDQPGCRGLTHRLSAAYLRTHTGNVTQARLRDLLECLR